jgi:hypothetical protein
MKAKPVKTLPTACLAGIAAITLAGPPAIAQEAAYRLPDGVVKATPLDAAEMDAIRGQGLPSWAVKFAVTRIQKALGNAAGRKVEKLLSGSTTPTFAEYRKAFGTKTALVLSLLPEILKPKIAQ